MNIQNKIIVGGLFTIGILLVSGFVFSEIISEQIRTSELERSKKSSEHVVVSLSNQFLMPQDFEPNKFEDKQKTFTAFFEHLHNTENIKIKVWSKDGTIIHSNDESIVAKNFYENERFQASLTTGIAVSEIKPPVDPENIGELGYGQLMEVYIPISLDSAEPLGVIELYYNLDNVNSVIDSTQHLIIFLMLILTAVISAVIAVFVFMSANIVTRHEKEKNEFISMITHELKTPLQPIQGYSYMLKSGTLGTLTESQQNAINIIDSNSVDLLALIENLLTAQKLEMKKVQFTYQTVSLTDFGKTMHKIFLPMMTEKNIKFENHINKNICVTVDPTRLKEIFTNLIQNSIDFVSSQNGKISFGILEETKDKVILFVEDNGSGIPKDYQSKLFTKFYQVDTSMSRKHGGTGLGLSICSEYVKQMGGEIWVKSKKDVGTTFYFTIPKSADNESVDCAKLLSISA